VRVASTVSITSFIHLSVTWRNSLVFYEWGLGAGTRALSRL
jgi:hypothetical protein